MTTIGQLSRPLGAMVKKGDPDLDTLKRGFDILTADLNAGAPSVFNVQGFGAKGDGLTDDTVAIQRAITAAGVAHGSVYFPPGTYMVSGVLSLPSYVTLYGDGPGISILKAMSTHTSTMLVNNNTTTGNTNIAIRDLEVDANASARTAGINIIHFSTADGTSNTNIVIERVYAHDSLGTAGSNGLGIIFNRVHGGRIADCHVANNDRDGITLYFDCQDIWIADNWVTDCGDDLIGLNAENASTTGHVMTRIHVEGNTLDGQIDQGAGIAVRGVTQSIICDNVIREAFAAGIAISNWNTTASTDLLIDNNVIRDAGASNTGVNGPGIIINSADSNASIAGNAGCRRITVSNNTINNSRCHGIRVLGKSGTTTDDIQILDNTIQSGTLSTSDRGIIADLGPIANLVIRGNKLRDAQAQGVYVVDAVNGFMRVTIADNDIYSSGKLGAVGVPTAAGIEVNAVVELRVLGNRSKDLAGAGSRTTTFGLRMLNCTTRPTVIDNDFSDNGSGAFSNGGGNDTIQYLGNHPLSATALTSLTGYYLIGDPSTAHLALDTASLQAKASATTAATLALQALGGQTNIGAVVTITNAGAVAGVTTLAAGTEVATPSVDSGAAVDLLLQRNNVTKLTLGNALATFVDALSVGAVQTKFTANENLSLAGVTGVLIIGGDGTGAHLAVDNNELMAKGSGTTTATLQLNKLGGQVNIGGGALTTENTDQVTQINCGTNAGGNDKVARIDFGRGGTILWREGLQGDLGTGGEWKVRDAVNAVTPLAIKAGALGTGNVTTTVVIITPASTTADASLRIPHGAAPTSPVNGDIWTTTAGLFVRVNGATVGPLT